MTAALRVSPFHPALTHGVSRWGLCDGMEVPLAFDSAEIERSRLATLALADLSSQRRVGLKGPGAAAWLAQQGGPVPDSPNAWVGTPGGGLVARLGQTEFLVEDDTESPSCAAAVAAALVPGIPGVTPVLRQDAKLLVTGERARDLFAETCAVPVWDRDALQGTTILTQMIGVGVTVIPGTHAGHAWYQVWSDATFAPYFWRELDKIAHCLGGGPVGLDVVREAGR